MGGNKLSEVVMNKKRLLMLLAFGFSFAPPVFAEDAFIAPQTGEMSLEQAVRGSNCDHKLKEIRPEQEEQKNEGSTVQTADAR